MHRARIYAREGESVVICSSTHETARGRTVLEALHALNRACVTRHRKEYSIHEDYAKFMAARLKEAGYRMTTTRVEFAREPRRR